MHTCGEPLPYCLLLSVKSPHGNMKGKKELRGKVLPIYELCLLSWEHSMALEGLDTVYFVNALYGYFSK